MASFFTRWLRRPLPTAACLACLDDGAIPRGPHALSLCDRCQEAVTHPDAKARSAKWGLSAWRRGARYARETADAGAPFLLTASDREIRMSHFEGFVSEDALAAAQDIVDEQRDTLSHYAIAFWGFVHQETKDFGFDAEPMHPDEALLIHAGSPGVDLAMLMGVLTKGKRRIAPRPTFFVGIDNWL